MFKLIECSQCNFVSLFIGINVLTRYMINIYEKKLPQLQYDTFVCSWRHKKWCADICSWYLYILVTVGTNISTI